MSLSLELLPVDVLVHLFSSHMDELTVEHCRAVPSYLKALSMKKSLFLKAILK